MLRAVQRRHQDALRDLLRVVALLHQRRQPARALPLDLRPAESWDCSATSARISSAAGNVLRSDVTATVDESIDELVVSVAPSCATSSAICSAVARLRAFVEHRRREVGESGRVGRVGVAAGADDEIGGNDRHAGTARVAAPSVRSAA